MRHVTLDLRRPFLLAFGLPLLLAACGPATVEVSPDVEAAGPPPAALYLALGDSLAVGYGLETPDIEGYVGRVHAGLEAPDRPVALLNLGTSGATARSVIEDGTLEAAVRAIEDARAAATPIDAITIDLGGNDAARLAPICLGGIDATCDTAAGIVRVQLAADLDRILGDLRAAAGPEVPMAVMGLYNALANPRCMLHEGAPIAETLLEGAASTEAASTAAPAEGFNDVIRARAAAHGARLVEVADVLGATGTLADCLHASLEGHALIAARFLEALRTP
ncbi:MAG: SGNH/GDSL hydrolase family protein [Dehalococcoidia bacterium]